MARADRSLFLEILAELLIVRDISFNIHVEIADEIEVVTRTYDQLELNLERSSKNLLRDHLQNTIFLFSSNGHMFLPKILQLTTVHVLDLRQTTHAQCYITHYLSIYKLNQRESRGKFSRAFSKDIIRKCPSARRNRQPTRSSRKLIFQLFQSTVNNSSGKIHYLTPASNKPTYNHEKKRKYQLPSTKTKRPADSFL